MTTNDVGLRVVLDACARNAIPVRVVVSVTDGETRELRGEILKVDTGVMIQGGGAISVMPLAMVRRVERPDGRPLWPRPERVARLEAKR